MGEKDYLNPRKYQDTTNVGRGEIMVNILSTFQDIQPWSSRITEKYLVGEEDRGNFHKFMEGYT